jgi:hypothetical protein
MKNTQINHHLHTVIRELLVTTVVTSQDELRRKLAGRGFHVTQATLSRDIHELRLSKGPAGYFLPGVHEQEARNPSPPASTTRIGPRLSAPSQGMIRC